MSAVIEKGADVVPMVRDTSPAALLAVAVERGADVGQLEKLMDLQERWSREEARKAFNTAKRAVEAEAPRIKEDAQNASTGSAYARLETINKALVPIYTANGFALSFSQGTTEKEGHIRIACDITHTGGHSEQKWVDLPVDDVGIKGNTNKTGVHATGSTLSYGRRYLTCMIFNISTGDDDDGQNAGRSDMQEIIDSHERMLIHMECVRNWFDTIECVKTCISTGNLEIGVEAWMEVPNEDKNKLWLAPSKGGIFTTKEREVLKSDEWGRITRERISVPGAN